MKKGTRSILIGAFLGSMIFGLLIPASAEETIDLRFSSFVPSMHFMNSKVFSPWVDMVAKQTNGKVQIKIYASGALGKPQDQYNMAVSGVADLTWGILAYTPGRFPLTRVMELPFMSPSAETGSRMVQRLYEGGHFQSEFKDVKLLALAMPPTMDLHTREKLVKSVGDMKGMKIRTPSPLMGKLIKKWGGAPVAMPAQEIYLSLERGVIDAIFFDPLTLFDMRCNEVTKYHTKVGISTAVVFFAMNKKTWNRLPPSAQKVIDELSGDWWTADFHGKLADKMAAGAWERLEKKGHTTYTLTPQELEKWKESASSAFDEWVKDMEAKGLPGQKVLNTALRLKGQLSK